MAKSTRNLLSSFKPESYDIQLNLSPGTKMFNGKVIVNGLKIGPPSHRLTFHQQNLKISSATIVRHNKLLNQSITIDRINHHKSFNEIRLHASEQLYGGKYTVTLNFNGSITDDAKKILLKVLSSNKNIQVSTNQFERNFASKIFPCIDDPEVNININLTLVNLKTTNQKS